MILTRSGCGCHAPCSCAEAGPALDPATGAAPTVRVRFNDGALLDAHDLRVEQNAHLWRDRLQALLLHGPGGVVWGLDVRPDEGGRVLRIAPGVALDPRGRLLLLPQELCLDLHALPGSFVDGLEPDPEDGSRTAYVVLAFEACTDEPVTALRPVCAEPPTKAWSRQIDSVRADLVADAPLPPVAWLRRWLGRPDPVAEMGDGRWLGAAPGGGDLRTRLLELSSAEASNLAEIWEDDTPVPILLARITLASDGDGQRATAVDVAVRPLAPPGQWVAETTLGVPLASGPRPGPHPVRALGVRVTGGAVEVALSGELEPATVGADAVSLWAFEAGAWAPQTATVSASGPLLTVTPDTAPAAGTPVQLRVHGTGEHALLGAGGVPFAGDAAPSALPRAHDLTLVATWS